MESEWVLVPRVPTEAMMKASAIRTRNLDGSRTTTWGANIWSAMLAAAPSAPTSHESPVSAALQPIEGAGMREALAAMQPFAECAREYISADESDEDWAKFRLIVSQWRRLERAYAALALNSDANAGGAA